MEQVYGLSQESRQTEFMLDFIASLGTPTYEDEGLLYLQLINSAGVRSRGETQGNEEIKAQSPTLEIEGYFSTEHSVRDQSPYTSETEEQQDDSLSESLNTTMSQSSITSDAAETNQFYEELILSRKVGL